MLFVVHLQGLEPWATDQESKPPVRLNLWKFRVIVFFNQNNVILHPVISASFVGFCTEKYPLHGLKPCTYSPTNKITLFPTGLTALV